MRTAIRALIFRALGKDPDAIVLSFASGDIEVAERMFEEMRRLEPLRRHFLIRPYDFQSSSAFGVCLQLRREFRAYRIGLVAVLFDGDKRYRYFRRAALLLAPTKILAYNRRLERHHLRLRSWIASALFLKGVPLDRIFLRPKWLAPWKRDRSLYPTNVLEIAGRPMSERRRRIAVLSPYFPYPLSHGGAVRIFNLIREMSQQFDVFLFAFRDRETTQDFAPLLEVCARLIVIDKARYREPRWASIAPPEAHEFRSPAIRAALRRVTAEYKIEALQVEYTMLAPYAGDLLVEHDVTFDLYRQVRDRRPSLSARWDLWRWRRFEKHWTRRYQKVAAMSESDARLLGGPNVAVIPNGVDLARFTPEIERPGERLLFIGSFRHFPNVVAYRFFVEAVWPLLREAQPEMRVTIVAGPDPLLYWREHTGISSIPKVKGIQVLEFVADVRPLYVEANLVLVPTLVSAGTNLKVLEALAMERAVVSTSSGCAGLGLEHGKNVWIADSAGDFAMAIRTLFEDRGRRESIAAAGRAHAERYFDWKEIGQKQRALLAGILPPRVPIRRAASDDLERIAAIQGTAAEASQWLPRDYLAFDCAVALHAGVVAGFVVSRQVADKEREILNIAVHPDFRRQGIATELLRGEIARSGGAHFLEVRESNLGARNLYERMGFRVVGTRPGYYENPPEPGIVMRILS